MGGDSVGKGESRAGREAGTCRMGQRSFRTDGFVRGIEDVWVVDAAPLIGCAESVHSLGRSSGANHRMIPVVLSDTGPLS